ncbi:MAG: hypothetical protein KDK11_09155 [Maritimibacter sp.]|nr:hypothetical protein [Maritimibacter sp.]
MKSVDYSNLARVVKVIDDFTVVINRGAKNGVQKGQVFLIFSLGEEVIDPETEESLGALETVRGDASVTHVQEAMSTLTSVSKERNASTRRTIRRPSIGILGLGTEQEEIFEEPSTKIKPLESEIGDYAKPV